MWGDLAQHQATPRQWPLCPQLICLFTVYPEMVSDPQRWTRSYKTTPHLLHPIRLSL